MSWCLTPLSELHWPRRRRGLGMRVVSMRASWASTLTEQGRRAAQNAIRTADQNQEEDAQGSVQQEVRCGHEQDRQSGTLAERFARRAVHGHAADETESLLDDDWKVLTRQARWTFPHLAARCASVRSDTVMQNRANRSVGLKPSWSKVSGPTGAIIRCLRQMSCTWPHTRPSSLRVGTRWTYGRLAFKAQARVDSSLALGRDWVDNDERRELLPMPSAGTCDTGEQASPTSPTRGASDQGGVGRDTSRMVDAGGGELVGNR